MRKPHDSILSRRWLSRAFALVVLVVGAALGAFAYPAKAADGAIAGVIFQDLNNNGVRDTGEGPHEGAATYIDLNRNGVNESDETFQMSDATGIYAFYSIADGEYDVIVSPPSGWGATTVSKQTVTIANGAVVSGVDFGISNVGILGGRVFDDVNGDGSAQTGDGSVFDVQVYLDTNGSGTYTSGEPTTRTNPNGLFSFSGLIPSTTPYRVRMVAPTNAYQVNPNPADILIKPGQSKLDIAFGLFIYGTISGTIYDDVDCNGQRDVGDAGASMKSVFLDSNDNGLRDSGETTVTTNSGGGYSITGIRPGVYRVRVETVPNDTMRSSANPADIAAVSGMNSIGNDIGLFTYGTISGIAYNDLNANGAKETTDTALRDRTIFLDANDNGTFDPGEKSAITAATTGE